MSTDRQRGRDRTEPIAKLTWKLRDPQEPEKPLQLFGNQWDFAYSETFSTLMVGGWGSGKTIGGIAFCDESAWMNPGCLGLIIFPVESLLEEFIEAYLKPAWANLIIGERRKPRWILYLPGGRRVICISGFKHQLLQTYTAAWAYADEAALMSPRIYDHIVGRVRDSRARRKRIGLTSVPLWGWLRDRFEIEPTKKMSMLRARTADNPYIDEETLGNYYDACPARLRDCYLNGIFVPPGGTVYPEFAETHIIPYRVRPDWPIRIAIDWSPRTPHVLFIQEVPAGTTLSLDDREIECRANTAIVIDEIVPTAEVTRIDDLGNQIIAKGYPLQEGVADKAGDAVEATSGIDQRTMLQQILRVPIYRTTNPRLTNIINGVEHVARMLSPVSGLPTLYFSKSLIYNRNPRACLNSLRSYSYPELIEGRSIHNQPVKTGLEHAMDSLRYYAVRYHPMIRLASRVRSTR